MIKIEGGEQLNPKRGDRNVENIEKFYYADKIGV